MSARDVCARLLEQYPRSLVEEAGVPTRPSTPRAAFQLLCAALLFGARIRIDVAQRAARALKAAGWSTPRRLRDADGHDPGRERELLLVFAGVGPVAADVFLRQAQTGWDELHPYVDPRAAQALAAVRLPRTGRGLARHVDPPSELCRIIDAAIRRERDLRRRSAA